MSTTHTNGDIECGEATVRLSDGQQYEGFVMKEKGNDDAWLVTKNPIDCEGFR